MLWKILSVEEVLFSLVHGGKSVMSSWFFIMVAPLYGTFNNFVCYAVHNILNLLLGKKGTIFSHSNEYQQYSIFIKSSKRSLSEVVCILRIADLSVTLMKPGGISLQKKQSSQKDQVGMKVWYRIWTIYSFCLWHSMFTHSLTQHCTKSVILECFWHPTWTNFTHLKSLSSDTTVRCTVLVGSSIVCFEGCMGWINFITHTPHAPILF